MKTIKRILLSMLLLFPLLPIGGCTSDEANAVATREELDAYADSVAPEELKQAIDMMLEAKKSEAAASE